MARCACPSANSTEPAALDAKSMPASAVPLVAIHCTRARPRSGCERLIRNTAATELSVVTILADSNEISLSGAGGADVFAAEIAAAAPGPRAGASAAVLVSLGGSENVKGLLSV